MPKQKFIQTFCKCIYNIHIRNNKSYQHIMQLSRYTDYALRTLIYLHVHHDRLCSIHEIATCYSISQNHLMKIVHRLGKQGFIKTLRGRNGGLTLNKDAGSIKLGDIIRNTEEDETYVKCDQCLIQCTCNLPAFLIEAMNNFYKTLNQYSLNDLFKNPKQLEAILKYIELI